MGIALMLVCRAACAEPAGAAPQTRALAPLAGNFAFTGTRPAKTGAAVVTRGHARCRWTFGGLWLTCDVEHTSGRGRGASGWSGRLTVGWDLQQQGYRALLCGSFGGSMYLAGRLEGRRLTLDSRGEYKTAGAPAQTRFTLDFSRPANFQFVEERSVRGGPWQTVESVQLDRQ